MRISFVKLAAFGVIIYLLLILVIEAKFILQPLVFAALLSLLLFPLTQKIEKFVRFRWISIIISIIVLFIPIGGFFTMIYYQLKSMIGRTQNLELKAQQLETNIEEILERWNIMDRADVSSWLSENLTTLVQGPVNFLGTSLSISINIGVQIMLILILTFLFLLYRDAIASFIITQMEPKAKEEGRELMRSIVLITQRYLTGMFLVILILSVLNSVGLWILGIPHAFFWGFVAGVLTIIPYIGTSLGGFLPFAYSLFIMESWWQPIGVILLYGGVQSLEGNFITPKVVGDRVQLNVVTALLALFIGNAIWGIVGMILAIPVMAAIKVMMEHISYTKPIAILMSTKVMSEGEGMEEKFNNAKYRFITLFVKDEEVDK